MAPPRWLAASMALGLLAACGGGGGAPPPPAPPPNQAPTFTSAGSVSIEENKGATVYLATATDPEGAPVTFSISGGPDSARFAIQPNGELSFFTPPNFDLPTDSDLNNVYQVEIAASDGQNQTTRTVSITVTNSKEGVAVRRIGTGFVNAAAISAISDISFLMADRDGAVYIFDARVNMRFPVVHIPGVNGPGMLAIAAARDYEITGRFFVMYTSNGSLIVQEYRRNSSGAVTSPNARPVLEVAAPDYAGGGWLGFEPQGTLLVATSDAGGTGDPTGSAQSDSSFLGKIIRVAPSISPFPYTLTRIAKGLHQPVGGDVYASVFSAGLLIGDRGQAVAEEINHLATGASGVNYGWPFKEGFQTVREPVPAGVVDPVTDYPRLNGAAVQGTVGGAVAGSHVASIAGDYVFADRSGAIFTIPTTRTTLNNARTGTERRTADFAPDVGAIDRPVAIIADPTDRLYLLDEDGELFRVESGG